MTFLDKYHENRESILLYMEFLQATYVHNYKKLQIIMEIARMESQNEAIRAMGKASKLEEFQYNEIEIDSKINKYIIIKNAS